MRRRFARFGSAPGRMRVVGPTALLLLLRRRLHAAMPSEPGSSSTRTPAGRRGPLRARGRLHQLGRGRGRRPVAGEGRRHRPGPADRRARARVHGRVVARRRPAGVRRRRDPGRPERPVRAGPRRRRASAGHEHAGPLRVRADAGRRTARSWSTSAATARRERRASSRPVSTAGRSASWSRRAPGPTSGRTDGCSTRRRSPDGRGTSSGCG